MAQEGDVLVAAASVLGKLGPGLGARVLLGNFTRALQIRGWAAVSFRASSVLSLRITYACHTRVSPEPILPQTHPRSAQLLSQPHP